MLENAKNNHQYRCQYDSKFFKSRTQQQLSYASVPQPSETCIPLVTLSGTYSTIIVKPKFIFNLHHITPSLLSSTTT
jgi:hypothetical protein